MIVIDDFTGEGEDPYGGSGTDDGENDPGPLIIDGPIITWPTLQFTSVPGTLDDFAPPESASSNNSASAGNLPGGQYEFDENGLVGTNWNHSTSVNYVSPTQWSFTETLVMAYNESTTESDEGSESGEIPNSSALSSSHWTSALTVTRSGFIIVTFSASLGMTTPAAAGVAWSIDMRHHDQVGLIFNASGGVDVTPDPNTSFPMGGTAGEGEPPGVGDGTQPADDLGGADDSDPPLPPDYTGNSSWDLGVGITIWTAGSLFMSSTPSLVGGSSAVRRDITSLGNDQTGSGLILTGGWASSSRSGHLLDATGMPIDGGTGTGGGDGEAPPWYIDPSGLFNPELDWSVGPDGLPIDPQTYSQVPELDNDGHEFGSSGGFNTQVKSAATNGYDLTAHTIDGRLQDIAGLLIEGLRNQIGDDYEENVIYSMRLSEGDIAAGNGWEGMVQMGWNVAPSVIADINSDVELQPSWDLATETMSTDITLDDAEISADTSGSGMDIVRVAVVVTETEPENSGMPGEQWVGQLLTIDQNTGNGSKVLGATADGTTETDDANGSLDLNWTGKGFSMVSVNSDTTHEYLVGGEGWSWDRAHNKDLDWLSTATYTSSGNVTATLTNGATSLSGSGSTATVSKVDYKSKIIERYDDRSWGDDHWDQLIYDYVRHAEFQRTVTESASFDAAVSQEAPFNAPSASGDTEVRVWGEFHAASGGGYDDANAFSESELQWSHSTVDKYSNYFPTPYDVLEANLDGIDYEPLESSFPEYPEDFVYPTVGNDGDGTWLKFVAGHKGDVFDNSVDYASGFGDNFSFGLSWLIREKVFGFDTVDYDSGYYTAGEVTATAIGVGGAGVGAAKGIYKLATAVDDLGRCANPIARMVMGGCFVPGTLVTLSSVPRTVPMEESLWGEGDFSELLCWDSPSGDYNLQSCSEPRSEESDAQAGATARATALKSKSTIQLPIEQVELGSRVPTKNPKPWEHDDSLPEPDESTWLKVSLTVERNDGGVVDAELLRPAAWVERQSLYEGQQVPLLLPELEVSGFAIVTKIELCPKLAGGDGSVVTGRFTTRRVDEIVRIEVQAEDGTTAIIEGTAVHPVWSLDRNDWVPLGELREGELLLGASAPCVIRASTVLLRSTPVYNIEVYGEHVFAAGVFRILVHNTYVPPAVAKALNTKIIHAAERALQRLPSAFNSTQDAADALRQLTTTIRNGRSFPTRTLPDPRRTDSVLVPFNGGFAVYEIAKNGVARLMTVIK